MNAERSAGVQSHGSRAWLLAVTLVGILLSGCNALVGTSGLVDAARDVFSDDISPEIRAQLRGLRDIPYAQLYVRFAGTEEAVFLLAEQKLPGGQDLWIGSGGVKLAMQGPHVRFTDGMVIDIIESESVRDGAVWAFLQGETDEIQPYDPSVVWIKTSESREWIEQRAVAEQVQEVIYQGFAYTGPAIKISERVQVTGQRGEFRRLYWIEPRTRSLLRMSTQIGTDSRPIVLEWVRTPDRRDSR
ncbi:MAG: YjbF family lipoprotein [Sinimarinibacterium flocculans]|uniref:YjbF family lipoprotein n=1 Tax=Sinimarinibacterium flocculans TaxID=985250 RepID=UPI003C4A4192